MSQVTDGTQLNPGAGGDLVSDEDMTGLPRLSPLVPQLGATNANYKVDRAKVALGDYGQDRGDPSNDGGRAFPVELQTERRLMEVELLRQAGAQAIAFRTRDRERMPTTYLGRTSRETGRI